MATLAELEKKKAKLKTEKKKYENLKEKADNKVDQAKGRKKKVQSLLNTLKWDFDNNVRTVNRHAEGIDSNIDLAIKGNNVARDISNTIVADKEKDVEKDSDLWQVVNSLDQEIKALETYENQMKEEKGNYSKRISDINKELFDLNIEISKKKLLGSENV